MREIRRTAFAGVLSIAAEDAGDDSVEQLLVRCCRRRCVIGSQDCTPKVLFTRCLVHANLIYDRGGLTLTDTI